MAFLQPPTRYCRYTKSKIDPDNPPPEVREAAADMGLSVHKYKEIYLDRPSICEAGMNLYNDVCLMCVRIAKYRKDDPSDCQVFLRVRKEYHCEKWEKKYLDPYQDKWLLKCFKEWEKKYLDPYQDKWLIKCFKKWFEVKISNTTTIFPPTLLPALVRRRRIGERMPKVHRLLSWLHWRRLECHQVCYWCRGQQADLQMIPRCSKT